MISLYQRHVGKWKDCEKCSLHHGRQHVVFARGQIPCDLLFVGEGPGESEDVLGKPFIGPAGKLLDYIVKQALALVDVPLRIAFTNIVGCIPRDGDDKANEPDKAEIVACTDKLKELIAICQPRMIIAVGNVSQKWLKRKGDQYEVGDTPIFDLLHPAAILKAPIASHSLSINKCIVSLRTAVEDLLEGASSGTTEETTSGITPTV